MMDDVTMDPVTEEEETPEVFEEPVEAPATEEAPAEEGGDEPSDEMAA